MFNCIYADGRVLTVEDLGECPAPREDGVELVDIAELSTTVEVTTAPPISEGLILTGVGLMILLGSSLTKTKGR